MAENETEILTGESSNFEPDNLMEKLHLTLVFAFFQMVICAGITFLPYLIFGHGYFSIAISNAMKFYTQADIGISTLVWYVITSVLLGSGWKLTVHIKDTWFQVVSRTGLIAILLAPGIFIERSTSHVSVLPALVSAMKYAFQTDLFLYRSWDFAWPIFTVWFIVLLATVAYKRWQVRSGKGVCH